MIDLSKVKKRSIADIAKRIVQDIPDGAHVNLGIGQPMMISNYLPSDKEILLHSENGLLGMGPLAKDHEIDKELVNAGKQPVTMLPGASLCHHADSFVMIRGGHIDICVLGAFQVSVKGDIANWRTADPKADSSSRWRNGPGFGCEKVICDDGASHQIWRIQAG